MAITAWPGAGRRISVGMAVPASISRRFRPAEANRVASTSPFSTFFNRVSTLPRIGTISRSGRRRRSCAARRGDEVPTRAFCLSLSIDPAPMIRSRTSPRGRTAAMWISSGRTLSTSFIEWTQKSTSPASRARSSSLVHNALPPISASGRSWTWSPVVLISTICTQPSGQRCDVSIAAATLRACASASGDPRVPRRSPCMPPPLVHRRAFRHRAGREMTVILGLESSCDDSAAALVTSDRRILAQAVVGQNSAHQPYGGVVPEIAARAHVEILPGLIEKVLSDAKMSIANVDAVAATAGPGLIGGVMVALLAGKWLALAAGKPLVAVNHLEGHALSPRLADPDLDYPYLLLLVSGGHCQLLEGRGVGDYQRLATTIDDAAGEAFDKAAKLLGLPYPGGPAIEELAKTGDPAAVPLPRPLVGSGEPHFSFAGLKSAVQRAVASGDFGKADIAASFQQAVVDCLADRTRLALETSDAPTLVVAGGVAANQAIRSALADLATANGRGFSVPPAWLCTDNAAMIAWAGAERLAKGLTDELDVPARARWPLDESAEKVRGAGVKA